MGLRVGLRDFGLSFKGFRYIGLGFRLYGLSIPFQRSFQASLAFRFHTYSSLSFLCGPQTEGIYT